VSERNNSGSHENGNNIVIDLFLRFQYQRNKVRKKNEKKRVKRVQNWIYKKRVQQDFWKDGKILCCSKKTVMLLNEPKN
jgi:hypothetical protein